MTMRDVFPRIRGLVCWAAVRLLLGAGCSACVLLGACGDGGAPSSDGGGVDAPQVAPAVYGDGPLLDELLVASSGAWLEIKNARDKALSLSGYALANDDESVKLVIPAALDALPALGLLVVRFDGAAGGTLSLHDGELVGAPAAMIASSGALRLLDAAGATVDRIAWGAPGPGAVFARGTGVRAPSPATALYARHPTSVMANDPDQWMVLPADRATPGAPNPLAEPDFLLPADGAELSASQQRIDLRWAPVAGAEKYRLQVATSDSFSAPTIDQVTASLAHSVELEPGSYRWRVRAIGAGGLLAGWTAARALYVQTASTTSGLRQSASSHGGKELAVPRLWQRKDTAMLLLDSKQQKGEHAWDRAHATFDANDKADAYNCVLAATAMAAAYYRAVHQQPATLSQDRIGHEVYKSRGVTADMSYGPPGLSTAEIEQALRFALVLDSARTKVERVSADWATVRADIDAGRPLVGIIKIGARQLHALVVRGYRERADGTAMIVVNDPMAANRADHAVPLISLVEMWRLPPVADVLLTLSGGQKVVRVGADEDGVSKDSDQDGVVDFDEEQRFGTDPQRYDSDSDGLGDKQEIFASVFEKTHGLHARRRRARRSPCPAKSGATPDPRDLDCDGDAPELDADSDGGGCIDGVEDSSGDGVYDAAAGEGSIFDKQDDGRCVGGTISATVDLKVDCWASPAVQLRRDRGKVTVTLQALAGVARTSGSFDCLPTSANGWTSADKSAATELVGLAKIELSGWDSQLLYDPRSIAIDSASCKWSHQPDVVFSAPFRVYIASDKKRVLYCIHAKNAYHTTFAFPLGASLMPTIASDTCKPGLFSGSLPDLLDVLLGYGRDAASWTFRYDRGLDGAPPLWLDLFEAPASSHWQGYGSLASDGHLRRSLTLDKLKSAVPQALGNLDLCELTGSQSVDVDLDLSKLAGQ